MPALICGSLAFDTITTFPGRFAEQILPEQVHILNVSFLVPTLRREYGGCAGNIAYTLQALGGAPVVMATLGNDGGDYLARLAGWGVDTSLVRSDAGTYTAQAIIITDTDNNQITAFHPGAMQRARSQRAGARRPEDRHHRARRPRRDVAARRAVAAADIPFVFDPGQQLPQFDGAELRRFVEQAGWVAVNDYEGRMLRERTGRDAGGAVALAPARRGRDAGARRLRRLGAGAAHARARRRRRGRGRPHRLRRRLPRRAAVRAGARLAAGALRGAGQPRRRAEDRLPRRAEPRHRARPWLPRA